MKQKRCFAHATCLQVQIFTDRYLCRLCNKISRLKDNENWVFRGTRVSPAQARSVKWHNSKCIERRVTTLVQCTSCHTGLSECEVTCQYMHNFLRYVPQEKVKKGDNSQIINARVMHLKHDTSPYYILSIDETLLQ